MITFQLKSVHTKKDHDIYGIRNPGPGFGTDTKRWHG
jgi:hypothetical protein